MCNSPHCLPAHTHTRSCSPQPVVPLLRALCKVQFANNTRLSQLVTLQWQAAVAVVVLVVGEFECSLRHARSHTHTLPIPLLLTRAPLTHIGAKQPPTCQHTLAWVSLSVYVYMCVWGRRRRLSDSLSVLVFAAAAAHNKKLTNKTQAWQLLIIY